jgi:hypothetical protein
MNKIFEMRLRPDPFNRICSGEKTIEYRLHDEKRSLLNKGDYIRFTEIADEERTVLVEIVDIFTASSFAALEQRLLEMGLLAKGSFSPIGMCKYYSVEDEERYSVMGIRIRVISSVLWNRKTVDIFPCTVGVDLFPYTDDINAIVSRHVEGVALLSKVQN